MSPAAVGPSPRMPDFRLEVHFSRWEFAARYLGSDGVEAFCRGLLEAAGVLLLPASIFASDLVPVPGDRFRIGIGRLDPGPALRAMDRYLAGFA